MMSFVEYFSKIFNSVSCTPEFNFNCKCLQHHFHVSTHSFLQFVEGMQEKWVHDLYRIHNTVYVLY